MAILTKNFVFGNDFLKKSLPEFKAHMKKTHRVSAKEAKFIFEEIHGNDSTVSEKAIEDSK